MTPKRIMIIGRPGGGKSTFAIKLHRELNMGIGVLKALFPNFRKYCDQKIAKKKSQSTTPACVLSSSNPCMWKIDPIHRVRLNFFVRFTPIRKPKTTTSRTAIASHFFLAFIKSSESLSQLVVLECQRPPWPTPKVPVSDWCVPESC